MFIIRETRETESAYVCQIDGQRFPFNPNVATEREAAFRAAEWRVNEIVVSQTQAGVSPDASLGERQRRFAAEAA